MVELATKSSGEDAGVLRQVAEKLRGGGRLDLQDGVALYDCRELAGLGRLAEEASLARHGRRVYYGVNRHINYTNVCRYQCRFCHFCRRVGHAEGYCLTPGEVAERAAEAARAGATEVHIVGGVHPELPAGYYVEMLEAVRGACPGLHIKAFTAVEVLNIARQARRGVEATLAWLVEAGLGSLPGGGAEILEEGYFRRNCPGKPGPREWLGVHAAAHRLGLMTSATMLHGFDETPAQRVGHLLTLRRLQDESLEGGRGHFQCFVPLPYVPPGSFCGGSAAGAGAAGAESPAAFNAVEDLKTMAISRLVLDNVPHVKAFWPLLGVNVAQVALAFGADDLEGTVREYQIATAEGAAGQEMSIERIERLIREARREPVRRGGLVPAGGWSRPGGRGMG